MRITGDVLDMVIAVGEDNEAEWLPRLNVGDLLGIFSEGLDEWVPTHAMAPKKNDSTRSNPCRSTIGLGINTP